MPLGDIVSKPYSKEGEKNYEMIFRKNSCDIKAEKEAADIEEDKEDES